MRNLRSALAALLLIAAPAAAEQPWLEPGDLQAKQDVDLLKAARFIRGPSQSWPLPWRQIDEGVQAALRGPAPPHVRAAAGRLDRLAQMAESKRWVEARVGGTNRPALIRGFGYTAREQGDVAVRVSRSLGRLYVSSGVGYRTNQRGRDVHFEPSYAALTLGNWLIYGGYVEKYWGAGIDGALVIGNSARPFPKIGVQRLYPYRPEPKFLRWLGPWRFDMFGGVLTEKRPDGDGPAYVGMQFAFEPLKGLEFSGQRNLFLCGGGNDRPPGLPNPVGGGLCDAPSVVKGIIPFFPGVKPGDSLAGLAVAYSRMIGPVAAKLHFEMDGEDKAGELQFELVGQQGGATLSGPIGDGGATWTVTGEYTDTLANRIFQSRNAPGVFYQNIFYFSGKYYRGDSIGHPIGGDSKLLTLSASVTDVSNRRFYGSYRDLDLNFTEALNIVNQPGNPISANRESIRIVTAGTEWPTPIGDVRLEARYMTDRPNTPTLDSDAAEFEVSWRTRF